MTLSEAYSKSSSDKDFYRRAEKLGIAFYRRGGIISGIKGNRKYRLKTLGFSRERILELEKHKKRLLTLNSSKSKNRDKGLER